MPKNNRGFTLIEVMIALVIASVSITALMQATSKTTTNISYFQNKTFASIIANNLAVEVRLVPQKLGRKEDDYKMANNTWKYRIETKKEYLKLFKMNKITSEISIYKNANAKNNNKYLIKTLVYSYQDHAK